MTNELQNKLKYFKTFIRLETPSYYGNYKNGQCGFKDKKQAEIFYETMENILSKLSYKAIRKDDVYYRLNEVEIFIHPQEISGIMTSYDAENIVKAIEKASQNIVKVRKRDNVTWIDLYDEYFNYSEIEYREEINKQKDNIKDYIVEHLKTNRKTQYKNIDNVLYNAFNKFQINTLNRYSTPLSELLHVCVSELEKEKKITKYQYENKLNLYRALNKTELKNKKDFLVK